MGVSRAYGNDTPGRLGMEAFLLGHRAIGLSGHRAIGPSGHRAIGPSGHRAIGPSAITIIDILTGVAKRPNDSLSALGRFSEAGFNILVALADGPKHGYAMMLDIEQMTGTRPGPGTLYAAISRLDERRWIEPLPSPDRRRPYRLTPAGRQVLRARVAALRNVTRVAQARLADV